MTAIALPKWLQQLFFVIEKDEGNWCGKIRSIPLKQEMTANACLKEIQYHRKKQMTASGLVK